MKRLSTIGSILLVLVLVGGVAARLWRQPAHMPPRPESATNPVPINAGKATVSAVEADLVDFATIRARLTSLEKTNTVAEIIRWLNTGRDAPTGQGFKLNSDGSLRDAPTVRVYLLDQLRRLDPAAAASYARVILGSKSSPDEWALALQSLATGDSGPGARDLLKQKFAEMLAYTPWQQSPSIGYLEAFDVAVFLGDPELVNPLAGLIRDQGNSATAHAAFLALDRMIINAPAAALAALEADPSLLQGREGTRADYFARADVQDAQQRQILEGYMLNPQISTAELQQFTAIFPNANYMISANLITSNPQADHAALAARDQASLQAVGTWLADPRFDQLRPQLQRLQQRLQSFVDQEQASGQ